MKNIYLLLFMTAIIGNALTGCKSDPCANKNQFLESFDVFINEFNDKKTNYQDADRAEAEVKYRALVNDCYKKHKPDMTLKERQDFWVTSLKFIIDRYDGQFSLEMKDKMDDPFNQYMKDEVVATIRESGAGFLMTLQQSLADDLPQLMETFSEELQQIGQEFLENLFK